MTVRRMAVTAATRDLEEILVEGRLGAWADDRLLDRFAQGGDGRADRAFAALVERHGPRVYRVCRAVTGDGHAAEDAFQATFLVLARKAGTLRVGESLGPWLHGVAARLAASARSAEARRKRHEGLAAHKEEPAIHDIGRDFDLCGMLHEEIGRLPAPFREAVYLCDVEGMDLQSAASRLSCAVGTVKSRLSRGRKRLRSKLVRRGIVPAALATVATRASAAVPKVLADSTVRNAMAITSGGAATGMVPAAAVALFEEGMSMMLRTKVRVLIGAVLVALTAAVAGVVAQDNAPVAERVKDAAPVQDRPVERRASSDRVRGPARERLDRADPFTRDDVRAVQDDVRARRMPRNNAPFSDARIDEADDRAGVNDNEVLGALFRKQIRDLTVQIEKVAEDVQPNRADPSIVLVTTQYKATVRYKTGSGDSEKSHNEQVHLEKKHTVRIPAARGPADPVADANANVTVNANRMLNPDRRPIRSRTTDNAPIRSRDVRPDDEAPARRPDTERRLDEVERKLERLLRVLERDKGVDNPKPRAENPPVDVQDDVDTIIDEIVRAAPDAPAEPDSPESPRGPIKP